MYDVKWGNEYVQTHYTKLIHMNEFAYYMERKWVKRINRTPSYRDPMRMGTTNMWALFHELMMLEGRKI